MKLKAFLAKFGTDEACRVHMERMRWPDGIVCPRCGTVGRSLVMKTRPGSYRCGECDKRFTVTVGTAMEGTHLPISTWYLAMFLMLSTAKPISAMSLMRQLGIQYRTCWHMLHRLRAMLERGDKLPLAGIVEADETYVGGKPRNRQKHRPEPTRGRGTDKPMLFAAVERGGRRAPP